MELHVFPSVVKMKDMDIPSGDRQLPCNWRVSACTGSLLRKLLSTSHLGCTVCFVLYEMAES